MAPIKFEEHIRERLQEREMTPSANAWEKLSAQLDADKKPSNRFLWVAIAASFVGIVIVASFLFSSEKSFEKDLVIEDASEVIKTETNELENVKSNNEQPPTKIKDAVIASEEKKTEIKEVGKLNTPKKSPIKTHLKTSNTTLIAQKEVPNSKNVVPIENQNLVKKEISVEDKKVDAIVAQVKALQEKNNTVSAKEIDDLLKNAQRELQTQRILSNTKIDATALLNDVELELEQTFRDKVFEALGDGFNRVRTAVADRNN